MRVKILSSTSTFNGVTYNTKKTHNQKGELMKHVNFGYMNNSDNVSPSELKAFLKAHSNTNSRVRGKQFHAMISCKGRQYDKHELTDIAGKWLKKMGYGENPYLIVFHNDTTNNHVHIVSSRIGIDGKKIGDSMERVRAQKSINEIMGLDQKRIFEELASAILKLNFSGVNQFKLYFENLGYGVKEENGTLKFFKFGLFLGEVPENRVVSKVKSYEPDKKRIGQLRALFKKYLAIYDARLQPVYEPLKGGRQGKQTGYRSDFSEFMRERFKVDIVFHGKLGKEPYGYTIIDFAGKTIFKGGEVMPLKKLVDPDQLSERNAIRMVVIGGNDDRTAYEKLHGKDKNLFTYGRKENYRYLSTVLRSILYDFNHLREGEHFHGVDILSVDNRLFASDKHQNLFMGIGRLLEERDYEALSQKHSKERSGAGGVAGSDTEAQPGEFRHTVEPETGEAPQIGGGCQPEHLFNLSIDDDRDDERVFGKSRKRLKEGKKTTKKIK